MSYRLQYVLNVYHIYRQVIFSGELPLGLPWFLYYPSPGIKVKFSCVLPPKILTFIQGVG
jgi:hypothetical protein